MFDNEIIEKMFNKLAYDFPNKINDATYITLYCVYIIEPQRVKKEKNPNWV